MFSSNQRLEITGSLDIISIKKVLYFALDYSDNLKNLTESERNRGCLLVYQITDVGAYCIGWGFETCPDGWLEYPFDFDIEIVARIIKQQLEKVDIDNTNINYDGSTEKGFLMSCMKQFNYKDVLVKGIKNINYGIVMFEPYINYYAK